MPQLSIITVNLNNASGLRKTIESVVTQTYSDYEYIIIDGGSSDESVEIIKDYSDKITYWISEPDKGIYNAMNKGLKQSKGEVVTFLNSGDEYYSCFSLEMVSDFLEKKGSLAEIFFFDFIHSSGNDKKLISSLDVKNKYKIFKKGFGHPSTFYSKKVFGLIGGFDESYKIAADRDFYMNAIVRKKLTYAYFPFPVSVFHDGGLSTNTNNRDILLIEDKRVIDTYYNNFEKKIIGSLLFRKIVTMKYVGDLLIWLLNWKLNQI